MEPKNVGSSNHNSSVIFDEDSNVKIPTKISILTMIMYSIPQLSFICMTTTLLTYIISLYVTTYNWSLDQIGSILSLSCITMAVSQPIAGLILGSSGDSFQTKKFKRAFILASLIFGLGFSLIIFLPSVLTTKLHPLIYLVAFVLGIAWSFYEVSFASIGANLSTNYDIRIDLQSWATIFYTLGIILCHTGHAILGLFLYDKNGIRYRNYILAFIFSVSLLITLFLFKYYVKDVNSGCEVIESDDANKPSIQNESPKIPLKEYVCIKLKVFYACTKRYLHLVSNRSTIALILMDTSNAIFLSISSYGMCFATKHIIEMPKIEAFSPLAAVVSMVLILPFWFKFRAKFKPEKRTSCFIAMLIQTICITLILFALKPKYLCSLVVILIAYGSSSGINHTTLHSMNGDVIDYIHSLNDKRNEGEIFGFTFFIKNGVSAIVLKLLYYYLEKYGYKDVGKLDPDVLFSAKIIYAIAFYLQHAMIYIALAFYKIDRESHKQIISDIAQNMDKKNVKIP